MYRKLLIKYKIHFASFAKPLHFLCKRAKKGIFEGCFLTKILRIFMGDVFILQQYS